MSGCFCKDLEIDGEFYGPCAACEYETIEKLAQEELDKLMPGVRLREQMELEDTDEYGCDGERSGLSGIIW